MKKEALEGEVKRLKQRNDELLSKMKDQQQSKEVMMQKLERLESMSPTSSVASMVSPQRSGGSDQEIQQLRDERDQLRVERDKANQDKRSVDAMFQESNRKSQNLTEQNLSLQSEIDRLRQDMSEQTRKVEQLEEEQSVKDESEREALERALEDCESLRQEMLGVNREKGSLASRVAKLERQCREKEEELEQLQHTKDQLRHLSVKYEEAKIDLETQQGNPSAESAEPKSMKNAMARRLNNALGENKELKMVSVGHCGMLLSGCVCRTRRNWR